MKIELAWATEVAEQTELTKTQLVALSAVAARTRANGYPPSLRELKTALKMKSLSSVASRLRTLEKKGMVRRPVATARGIHVTERGLGVLVGHAWREWCEACRVDVQQEEARGCVAA